MGPIDEDMRTLEQDVESLAELVRKALTTSDLLSDVDRSEFERVEESIVASRRRAELTAGSLRFC